MNRTSLLFPLCLGASVASAVVPYRFGPGSPARSQEVNDNFTALDTSLQALSKAKASNQDLSSLRIKVSVDSAFLARAMADSVASLRKAAQGAVSSADFQVLSGAVASKASSQELASLRSKASADSASLSHALADSAATWRKATQGSVTSVDFQALSATVSSKASSQELASLRSKASADSASLSHALADSAATWRKATQGSVTSVDFQALSATVSSKASSQELASLRSKASADSTSLTHALADSAAGLRRSIGEALTATSLAGIRDTLGAKLDTSFRSQVALATPSGVHANNFWLSEQDQPGPWGSPAFGIGRSASLGDQMVVGGYNGIQLRTGGNALVVPGSGDPTINANPIWHAGNLKPDALPYIRAAGNGNTVSFPFQVGALRGEGAAVLRDWRSMMSGSGPISQRVGTLELNWYNHSWLLSQVRSEGMPSGPFTISLYDYTSRTSREYFSIQPENGNTSIAGNLVVNGILHSSAVATAIRASDVADYVFEPDYKLAPLSEVEEFTKANKHLPEVPSATELEATGVDLAKMNMVLLKKVEELTLHAIEQNKRLEDHKQRLERQQRQLDALTSAERP